MVLQLVLADVQAGLDAVVEIDVVHPGPVEAAEVLEIHHQFGNLVHSVQGVVEQLPHFGEYVRFQEERAQFFHEFQLRYQFVFLEFFRSQHLHQDLIGVHQLLHLREQTLDGFHVVAYITERGVDLVRYAGDHLAMMKSSVTGKRMCCVMYWLAASIVCCDCTTSGSAFMKSLTGRLP